MSRHERREAPGTVGTVVRARFRGEGEKGVPGRSIKPVIFTRTMSSVVSVPRHVREILGALQLAWGHFFASLAGLAWT